MLQNKNEYEKGKSRLSEASSRTPSNIYDKQ